MFADLEVDAPATWRGLRSCLESVQQCGTRWGVPHETILRLQIVVEELFSNTIKYGYGAECERPVRIRLRRAPALEIDYEDEAPPFDPTAWRGVRSRVAVPEGDGIGQRGIALALGLAQSARYERLPAGNRLRLRFV